MNQDLHRPVDRLPAAVRVNIRDPQALLQDGHDTTLGGGQAVDWAKRILTQAVIPPRRVELPFYSIDPKSAQDLCNQYKCPDAKK